jgi:predicted extracellular nuclease
VIGFYNLENFFDTLDDPKIKDEEFLPTGSYHYTSDIYLDKVRHLATVISQIGTEFTADGLAMMGCAEVENEGVLKDLIHDSLLAGRHYAIVHYDSPDERGIDVGLIYNPKYFKPERSAPLFVHLPDENDKPHYTRDVLYVTGKLNGEQVHVFVNHWPSRRGGEEVSAPNRAIAAAVAKHAIDSIEALDANAKIILMGDLNDDPISPSVAKVLNAKGDEHDVQQGDLFNPWADYYKKGIGTLAFNDSWNLFDQIMISSPFLNKSQEGFFFREAKIFSRPWMIQSSGRFKGYPKRTFDYNKYIGGYSDHFPTYIELLKEVK